MNIIRVELLPNFMWGDDVVLLTMDGPGLATFAGALNDAVRLGSSRLEHGEVMHGFVIQAGAADVVMGESRVVWRLAAIRDGDGPGHKYVDIAAPTKMLVLSRYEYMRGVPPS